MISAIFPMARTRHGLGYRQRRGEVVSATIRPGPAMAAGPGRRAKTTGKGAVRTSNDPFGRQKNKLC